MLTFTQETQDLEIHFQTCRVVSDGLKTNGRGDAVFVLGNWTFRYEWQLLEDLDRPL